jgi:hypothetical protein
MTLADMQSTTIDDNPFAGDRPSINNNNVFQKPPSTSTHEAKSSFTGTQDMERSQQHLLQTPAPSNRDPSKPPNSIMQSRHDPGATPQTRRQYLLVDELWSSGWILTDELG